MSFTSADTSYPTNGGYTCVRCGSYVPNGCSHACAGGVPDFQDFQAVKWDRMSDVRIADALERIATALECIAQAGAEDPAQPKIRRGQSA